MKSFSIHHAVVAVSILAVPVLMGAEGNGCGGDVVVGNDGPCVVTGCSGQICADEDTPSTCEWTDAYACYQQVGVCERAADGTCGWRETPELSECLSNPEPEPCVVTGCSGQICADQDMPSDCQWLDEYACYHDHGVCERDEAGTCGWKQTPELVECLEDPRVPVEGGCIKNAGHACESDADCVSGGCGGELCFNPALSEGISTCECGAPQLGCGCVLGTCTWYE